MTHYQLEATEFENNLAQQYCNLVEIIKENIKDYLIVEGIKKKELQKRIIAINGYYQKLFDIQYGISQISRKKVVRYKKKDESEAQNYNVIAVDIQAQSWLNRLQYTLNISTIKLSEFNVRVSFRRDIVIFALSVIVSACIGYLISMTFDSDNDNDLKEFKEQLILNYDSIKTKLESQNDLIKQNTMLLDSLISNKKNNGTNKR